VGYPSQRKERRASADRHLEGPLEGTSGGRENLPNFFIVGAPKAGTTSLHEYCRHHPDVFMSTPKEPHFFSSVDSIPAWRGQRGEVHASGRHRIVPTVRDPKDYAALFESADRFRVRGESSTSYLSDPLSPNRIRLFNPDARAVAMLRNPVSRAVSSYRNHVREGVETRTFEQALDDERNGHWSDWATCYLSSGLYADQVQRFESAFGENFLVLISEEFYAAPREHVRRVFRFLGVDELPADSIDYRIYNADFLPRNLLARAIANPDLAWSLGRRLPDRVRRPLRRAMLKHGTSPDVLPETRSALSRFYADDIRRLQLILGKELPWLDP
jgi:hypothetical protein